MASTTQPPSFMLLPDYTYPPNKDIHLGTLLLLSEETKLPNPDLPLNKPSRIPVSKSEIRRMEETSWSFVNGKQHSASAGFQAELPIFSPVGGGVGYGRSKSEDLTINCERLETERFVPSWGYLSMSLKDDYIQEYCRQYWSPSVYMVTGIKIAHNAVIENGNASGRSGHGNLSVDTTAAGVPLKVKPSLGASKDSNLKICSTITSPFILAYQLKRLKLKRDGLVRKVEGYNKHALMDDRKKVIDDTAAETLDEFWDVHDVFQTMEHDR